LKLTNCGITVEVTHPNDIARLKRLGYKEDKPPEKPKAPEAPAPAKVSLEKIYALCEEAGVKPDDLVIDVENPTLAQVKAAIKAAAKAVTDGE